MSVSGSPSFPSRRASTAFAAATAVAILHPRLRWPAFVAALVALSRAYVGVHYTTDVVAGAAVGALIGVITVWTARSAAKLGRRRIST